MLTFDGVVQALRDREPLTFSRWGDGEWSAILGHGHQNCDGEVYVAGLRRELAEVLEDKPNYHLGMQSLAVRRFGPEIEAWQRDRGLRFDWCDAGLFHSASIRDALGELVEAMQRRAVVLVGPKRLGKLPIPWYAHVIVPETDAYSALNRLVDDTRAAMTPDCVVAVSAGPAAKILVHRVAQEDVTVLDFGSVWEPYVGCGNRSYHRRILERIAAA